MKMDADVRELFLHEFGARLELGRLLLQDTEAVAEGLGVGSVDVRHVRGERGREVVAL